MQIKKNIFNSLQLIKRKYNIHFIGIGGSGMSGIAELLLSFGHKITGSDILSSYITQYLSSLGIKIFFSHCESNIKKYDFIVISSAISIKNPEVIAANKKNIPIFKRAQILSKIINYFKNSIAVIGTHGKTTTTAMLGVIYENSGLDPTIINGGIIKSLKNSIRLSKNYYNIIVEADESDASFLFLQPVTTIITNIDYDHMQTYSGDIKNLKKSFLNFLNNVSYSEGYVIIYIDEITTKNLLPKINRKKITYGFNQNADVKIKEYKQIGTKSYFKLIYYDKSIIKVVLNMPGYHNALNATAAIIASKKQNISEKIILDTLKNFKGIERRFDILGCIKIKTINNKYKNITFIHDYGHHPKELKVTINAIRIGWPKEKLIMIFQPHRYTRTKDLYQDFISVLSKVDILLLLNVYSAGEKNIIGADSFSLYQSIVLKNKKVVNIFINYQNKILKILKTLLIQNTIVLFQGAGDIDILSKKLFKKIKNLFNEY